MRLLSALIVLAGPASALAQQPGKAIGVKEKPAAAARIYEHLHALCIGINDYASPDVPDLSYAEADARDVSDVLTTLYGFDDVRVLLGRDATRKRISDAIADLFDPSHVSKNDCVVIYFSGHGQTVRQGDSEGGYLIPQDANISLADVKNPAPYRRDALRMDDLRTDADGVPAKHLLFLIDACYGGYLASRTLEASPDLVAALKYSARQVITAGTAGEQSVEHNAWGHGALTYKLLEILRAEERPIQASRLGVMLKERVPREVEAKFGRTRSLSPQAKYLSGDGDFLFVRPGTLANSTAPPQGTNVRDSGSDAITLLREGDRQVIERLVSAGQYRDASEKLTIYEKSFGTDAFAVALRPALNQRMIVSTQPATTRPAKVDSGEILPLDLIESGAGVGARTQQTEKPVNNGARPAVTPPSPGTPRPRGASRANHAAIRLNSLEGTTPHFLTYSVDLPSQAIADADFLWMDNGVWMGDERSGTKILESPGTHRISVLVITRDNKEYRGAAEVKVLKKN